MALICFERCYINISLIDWLIDWTISCRTQQKHIRETQIPLMWCPLPGSNQNFESGPNHLLSLISVALTHVTRGLFASSWTWWPFLRFVHTYVGTNAFFFFFFTFLLKEKLKHTIGVFYLLHIQLHMQAARQCQARAKTRGSDMISKGKETLDSHNNKHNNNSGAKGNHVCGLTMTNSFWMLHWNIKFIEQKRKPCDASCPQCTRCTFILRKSLAFKRKTLFWLCQSFIHCCFRK